MGCDYKIYCDVYSGASITRTGWQQLEKDIENNIIGIMWVGKIDRLARNTLNGL